jgi:hypothetical protein
MPILSRGAPKMIFLGENPKRCVTTRCMRGGGGGGVAPACAKTPSFLLTLSLVTKDDHFF